MGGITGRGVGLTVGSFVGKSVAVYEAGKGRVNVRQSCQGRIQEYQRRELNLREGVGSGVGRSVGSSVAT